jgi:hypothetical protein
MLQYNPTLVVPAKDAVCKATLSAVLAAIAAAPSRPSKLVGFERFNIMPYACT